MIQMGCAMPCLYEQMAAVPAMASAQQSGNSNNSSNNSSNNNSNNNVSQSYEEMLGGSSGAGGMSLVQGGASGQDSAHARRDRRVSDGRQDVL